MKNHNNIGKIYKNCTETVKNKVIDIDLNIEDIVFENDTKKNFLLVGEVQSGKTAKIIELIKHAVDRGYDFCIVFGGVTNLLNEQTKHRFERGIPNEICGRKKDFIDSKKITKNLRFNTNNFFYILTFLKGSEQIKKLNNLFMELINFNTKKVLLIDDETDYATVISNKHDTAIHKLICDI
jgi:GTPase SAR1 family protein